MDLDVYEGRTLDEVKRVLGFAKLDDTEVKSKVQCLSFESELDNDSVKLLEMDVDVAVHLHEGQSLILRGDKTESAVLCTKDKTFDIKDAETSNLLLLVPTCQMGADFENCEGEDFSVEQRQVCAMKQDYYELKLIQPRLKKLKFLLEQNMFSGKECEEDEEHQKEKYTLQALLEVVQASEVEIKYALVKLQACLIEGHWRKLDFDLVNKILSEILSLKEEQGWNFEAIPGKYCCDILEELYPRNVIVHVVRCFCDLPDEELLLEDLSSTEDQIYKLSEDKICCFFAVMILKDVDKFALKEFCNIWQLAVPEGLNTGLYQLEGVTLIERDVKPEVIRYFPVCNLPEDVGERFMKLFKTKPKWSLDEITPFIKDLCTEKITVDSLLLKYCRASTQNGIRVYSSKRLLT